MYIMYYTITTMECIIMYTMVIATHVVYVEEESMCMHSLTLSTRDVVLQRWCCSWSDTS
jgi:hypothetical protein